MLSEDERKQLGITFSDDGEFWWVVMDHVINV